MLRLPRIQPGVAMADSSGKPSRAFVSFWNTTANAIEKQEVAQDATIAALQVQVDRLTAFLNGTGESITSAGAFASGVVPTRVIAVNAVTNDSAAFTAATLAQSAATETDVQTVSFTTTGETIEVRANFFLTVWHPTAGGIDVTIRMYRDATVIYSQLFTAINGDLLQGWQTPAVIEDPAAGTYTFKVTVQCSNSGFATAETSSRLLALREFKR